MESMLIGVIFALVVYLIGYTQGKRHAKREIFEILNVPEGYEIDGVSYRKKGV